jgi:hypothetical protein
VAPPAARPAAAGERSTQATLALIASAGLVAATLVMSRAGGMSVSGQLSSLVTMLSFAGVGFVVARNQPHNRMRMRS